MSSPTPETDSARLAAVILGASQYPNFPSNRRLDNPSFARSAAAFRDLIAEPGTSLAGATAVLDLFDSAEDPVHLIRRIKDFLKSRPALTDIIIYYCGHGSFLADAQKTYILTLRATEPDNEAFTALPLRQTRLSLDAQLALKRVYLVLDCCYAGRAATEWQSDSVGHVIEEQVFEAFPRRGTALIAAASRGEPAISPEAEPLTMFSGSFIETLNLGIAGQGRELSFRDVFTDTRRRIVERYGAAAAIPVIHAPYQPDGDISFEPFFVNRAYEPQQPAQAGAEELDYFATALADLSSPYPKRRINALEILQDLHVAGGSPSLRADIVARLEKARDSDDFIPVREKAVVVLAELGRTARKIPPREDASVAKPAASLAAGLRSAVATDNSPKGPTRQETDALPIDAPVSGSGRGPVWFTLLWRAIAVGGVLALLYIGGMMTGLIPRTLFDAVFNHRAVTTSQTRTGGGSVAAPVVADSAGAVLLETSATGGTARPVRGTLRWSRGIDKKGVPTVVGEASIPTRGLSLELVVSRNSSTNQSHIVEVAFSLTDAFAGGSIASLTDVRLRTDARGSGTPLSGFSSPYLPNIFMFMLHATPSDVAADLALLKAGKWIDIDVVYAGGAHATLTLEKDAAADQLFKAVLSVWASS